MPGMRNHRVRNTAAARESQPAMKQAPPSGVMAPNARMPVSAMAYSEPEKRMVPATKSQPLAVTSGPGQRLATQATASKARACPAFTQRWPATGPCC